MRNTNQKSVKVKYAVNWRVSPALAQLPTINSSQLEALQGNLKDLADDDIRKLCTAINEKGFFVPFFMWRDEEEDINYVMDGHQRLRIIQELFPGGVHVPYVPIEADDYQDAKERLLLIDSRYGKITKEGFDEYTADMVDFEDFVRDMATFEEWLDPEEADDSTPKKNSKAKAITELFVLEVSCGDSIRQASLYDELLQRGYIVKTINS